MLASTDQMGNKVALAEPPQRIVSLVPSQTELLYDLGLEDRVVGITKFCVHPGHWRTSKTVIGGTKNFNIDVIEQLKPDLIIGNKEENYEEGINGLKVHCPVWMSDITTFDDALQMIQLVSLLTNCEKEGMRIKNEIQFAFNGLQPLPKIKTLYLMWRNPWMGPAGKTFIHSMMEKMGFVNVLAGQDRYPELSEELIKHLNPALVLLSTEPFPFIEKHLAEIKSILPDAKVLLVDGEMFSWYGSRLALAPAYLNSIQIGC